MAEVAAAAASSSCRYRLARRWTRNGRQSAVHGLRRRLAALSGRTRGPAAGCLPGSPCLLCRGLAFIDSAAQTAGLGSPSGGGFGLVGAYDMLQTFCGRYSLKTGAVILGIFFTVNALVHLFVGFFFFISKTRFYKDEMPMGLAAGSLAVGAVQLFANVALVEGAMKRSRRRLLAWQAVHSLLLAAYAAAAAALWMTLLDAAEAQLPVLRRLCPQVVAALLVLLTIHGGLQVYALVVVESLRRKFLKESPPPSLDIAYQRLERY